MRPSLSRRNTTNVLGRSGATFTHEADWLSWPPAENAKAFVGLEAARRRTDDPRLYHRVTDPFGDPLDMRPVRDVTGLEIDYEDAAVCTVMAPVCQALSSILAGRKSRRHSC